DGGAVARGARENGRQTGHSAAPGSMRPIAVGVDDDWRVLDSIAMLMDSAGYCRSRSPPPNDFFDRQRSRRLRASSPTSRCPASPASSYSAASGLLVPNCQSFSFRRTVTMPYAIGRCGMAPPHSSPSHSTARLCSAQSPRRCRHDRTNVEFQALTRQPTARLNKPTIAIRFSTSYHQSSEADGRNRALEHASRLTALQTSIEESQKRRTVMSTFLSPWLGSTPACRLATRWPPITPRGPNG